MDDWGTIEGACPCCGGDVKWYEYSVDCRGNPGSSGARCINKCVWTEEQQSAFWADLRAKKKLDWERLSERNREETRP